MKKSLAVMLALIMVLCMIPTTAFAASNSTVVLHPSFNHTVTGIKVKVGDKIDGHPITKISGYDITVDLGKYNVNNDTFRLPYAKDIWEGVDNNKVDYISWAGSGSNRRSEGASALLANGKNTAYYYFKGAPTYKTFTLKYDANGGTGAPATQTYTATSQYENSHTFTISNDKPTRQDYEFKGWAETPNATTATRQPGGSIVVTGTTTLYAVWANHEHKDENGDGYCDTDHECMHEKDQDGYCIVDGCTHPHEGDGACCPKKPDNKPNPPEPENTSKPFIELTGEEAVKVHCTNDKANHDDKSYGLMHDGYTVGEVQGDKENGYFCEITVKPEKYVAQYNLDISGVTHTLVDSKQTGTIKLVWEDQKWNLANPSGVPVVFDVKCKTTQPENPAELTYFAKSRVTAITDNMPKPPEGVTFNTNPTVTFDATNTTAYLLYSFTVTGTPGAEVTITDNGAKFYNNGNWVENSITVILPPIEGAADYATYTVYGYRQFTKDNIINGALMNTATARVEGSEELVPGEAKVPAEDKTGSGPSENPNPSPSTDPNPSPTPTPTPGGGNGGGGHSHYYPTTTPVPVIVIPPKTGDMTIWQSILHFLGIR